MSQAETSLNQILRSLGGGQIFSAIGPQLEAWELADEERSRAFDITQKNVGELLEERSRLFQSIYPAIEQRFNLETLWKLWLPLGRQLAECRQTLGRPLIQGILGGQGTGKTTLAAILKLILAQLGYRTLSLSLDDLYKTYRDRQRLKAEDPRLIWRGPPGTHDIELGISVLDRLREQQNEAIAVPRFDKSAWEGAGDRAQPEIVEGADIILFEGWFVGARPIDSTAFDAAPAPILSAHDKAFARDMNAKLHDYLPLWERLDRLMVLYPVDYRLSLHWRKQAEQQMKAAGKSGMSDAEIEQFVNYFWRALHPELFIKPLVNNADLVDLVVEINPDHSVSTVYKPRNSSR